LVLHSGVV